MDPAIIIVAIAVLGVVTAFIAMYSILKPNSESTENFGSVSFGSARKGGIARSARQARKEARQRRARVRLVLDASAESAEVETRRQVSSYNSLSKLLRYANWNISPATFRILQVCITIAVFVPVYLTCTVFVQILVVVLTPLLIKDVLMISINRRFNAFDKDYPVLLMQFVSFFKTGMMYITALKESAMALPEGSIVRSEVEVMIERLRLGMSEDQAVGAFGEDIAHPEIELFVQTLLLHGKIGGKITPTLERLARQVRKRQQFRKEAVAAVAMERMSIFAISGVMIFVLLYMLYNSPELILSAFTSDLGVNMFQGGLSVILFGFYWSKQVTKIKV